MVAAIDSLEKVMMIYTGFTIYQPEREQKHRLAISGVWKSKMQHFHKERRKHEIASEITGLPKSSGYHCSISQDKKIWIISFAILWRQ